ncbi:hypothetical protein FF1_017671 [Malus domestica]
MIIEAASSLRGSTMATIAVATTVTTTCGEVYGTTTTARAMPSKAHGTKATAQAMSLQAQRELNVLPSQAQASHPCASHSEQSALTEQPTLMAQPAPAEQPTLMAQLALVAQPAPDKQPTPVAQPTSAE